MRTETWLYCVDMIDALLKELFTSGSRAKPSVRASGGTLGRDRTTGKEVKMMMHHRGITSAQQWAETENLALQGSCRVFKMFFPKLISLDKFNQLWHTFTNIIVEGMTSHHNMVAITGIILFLFWVICIVSYKYISGNYSITTILWNGSSKSSKRRCRSSV